MSKIQSTNGLSYYFEKEYEGISEIDNPTLIYINGVGDATSEHIIIDNYFIFATPTITCLSSDKIKELSIGNKVSIYPTALKDCVNLKKINVLDENEYNNKVINNCIVYGTTAICLCPNSIIPAGGAVKRLGYRTLSAFFSKQEIVIPEGIQSLGDEICFGLKNLKKITLPKTLKEIGKNPFNDCVNLIEIIFNGNKLEWEELKTKNNLTLNENIKIILSEE